jgi:hypothetical protein
VEHFRQERIILVAAIFDMVHISVLYGLKSKSVEINDINWVHTLPILPQVKLNSPSYQKKMLLVASSEKRKKLDFYSNAFSVTPESIWNGSSVSPGGKNGYHSDPVRG